VLGRVPSYQWTREDEELASGSKNRPPNQTEYGLSEESPWIIVLQRTNWRPFATTLALKKNKKAIDLETERMLYSDSSMARLD
jgi:hypothetical protein